MNPALKRELDRRWRVTRQAKSQKANRLRKEFGPLTADEAGYIIAHQLGINLARYLSADEVKNVRQLLGRVDAQAYLTRVSADASRAAMRKQIRPKAEKAQTLKKGRPSPLPSQDWSFIENDELRSMLERDYAELGSLLNAGAPKSTLMLLGSMLEAMLMEILARDEAEARKKFREVFPDKEHPGNAAPPLKNWGLDQLIQVSRAMSILDDNSKRIAMIVKDYRNVIHPMVEVRREANINDPDIVNAMVSLFKYLLRYLALRNKKKAMQP